MPQLSPDPEQKFHITLASVIALSTPQTRKKKRTALYQGSGHVVPLHYVNP